MPICFFSVQRYVLLSYSFWVAYSTRAMPIHTVLFVWIQFDTLHYHPPMNLLNAVLVRNYSDILFPALSILHTPLRKTT